MEQAELNVIETDNFFEFESKQELTEMLAQDVADSIYELIEENGHATIAVSGGGTPAPFFAAFAKIDLDFSKITMLMVDERWVATSHSDSSERLLHEAFAGLPLNIFSLAPQPNENVMKGAQRLNTSLAKLNIDIAILGMGDDGHTASLFPNHPALKEGLNPNSSQNCLGLSDSPKPPSERVTLTYSKIIQAQQLILHITGASKKQVLERAWHVKNQSELPISAFLQQTQTPVYVYYAG
jgi:6-phosphogluconolactonase